MTEKTKTMMPKFVQVALTAASIVGTSLLLVKQVRRLKAEMGGKPLPTA